ncbi:MAG: hypothetical protein KKC51_15065 [Verrucomicrobia bacterium]|nr:hypothetical protein [Verrucomicrobiota bacterium]
MLYYMARGESGRIVLEIDPSAKDRLYEAVTKDGLTLKEWFLRKAEEYLRDRGQLLLFTPMALAETPAKYRVRNSRNPTPKPSKSGTAQKTQ